MAPLPLHVTLFPVALMFGAVLANADDPQPHHTDSHYLTLAMQVADYLCRVDPARISNGFAAFFLPNNIAHSSCAGRGCLYGWRKRRFQVLWRVIVPICKTGDPVEGLYIFITDGQYIWPFVAVGREDLLHCKSAGAALPD